MEIVSGIVGFFGLIFVFVLVGIVFVFASAGKAIADNHKQNVSNREKPIVTVRAKVVGKRPSTTGGGMDTPAMTSYYVTFEFIEDGTREEFSVPGKEYGMIAEGDSGRLTRQGTWFKYFERIAPPVSPSSASERAM